MSVESVSQGERENVCVCTPGCCLHNMLECVYLYTVCVDVHETDVRVSVQLPAPGGGGPLLSL